MYYSGTILKMAGITSDTQAMWISAAITGVFAVFTIIGLLLVERVGRKTLMLTSLLCVFVSLLVIAQAFYLTESYPIPVDSNPSLSCTFDSCTSCLQHHICGFCASSNDHGSMCLSNTNKSSVPANCTASYWYAAKGDTAISDVCPSKYSWLTIIALCLYLSSFGVGIASLPWTINAEIFPTHVRSSGTSYSTAVNWICNLGVSLSFLSLTNAITRAGTFWLYAGITLLSTVYVYFALPETKGKSLEDIENIFIERTYTRKNSSYSVNVA